MNQEKRWEPRSPLVTAPELPELAARYPVLVVHCGAVWDGYDVKVDIHMQSLRIEFGSRIGFYALDIDEGTNWEFLKVAIGNIPAIVGFVNVVRQPTITGAHSEEYLRERFQEWLALADAAPESTTD